MKNKLLKALLIAVLVLLVPFLIGRVSVVVLEGIYPGVEEPPMAQTCREANNDSLPCIKARGDYLSQSLNRKRNITKITLAIIGVYYLALIAVWLIRRRMRRSRPEPETSV